MSPDEIYQMVNRICWGKRYTSVFTDDKKSRSIVIRCLTVKERNYADFVYERTLNEALHDGAASRKELATVFLERGLWFEDDERRIPQLEINLEGYEKNKKRFESQTSKIKILDRHIKETTKEIIELKNKKTQLFDGCAELMAEQRKAYYELQSSIESPEEKPFWNSKDGIEDETDKMLINNIMIQMASMSRINEGEYRELARSSYWRLYWNAGKTIGVFGQTISEYTLEQVQLSYWSQFYDSIAQMYEGPNQEVVEDDKKLDSWLEDYFKKQKNGAGSIGFKTRANKAGAIGLREEVFILSDAEGAKDVYDKNTRHDRQMINMEQKHIAKSDGEVTDYQLRKMQIHAEMNRRK